MTKLNHEFFTEAEFRKSKPVGSKGYQLNNGEEVWFYYANNRGRGNNNVTALHVESGHNRYDFPYVRNAENANIVIQSVQLSAWRGKLSRYVKIFD